MAELSKASANNEITDALLKAALPIFAKEAWDWYDKNKDDVLFQKRVLFLSFDVKVSSFVGILETLFGPRPNASA